MECVMHSADALSITHQTFLRRLTPIEILSRMFGGLCLNRFHVYRSDEDQQLQCVCNRIFT